jgi:hypothetical protein
VKTHNNKSEETVMESYNQIKDEIAELLKHELAGPDIGDHTTARTIGWSK